MIRIITIEREYGCGAATIARMIADRLKWKVWDQEITAEIARRLKCKEEMVAEREERLDPMYYRLIKVFMRGSFEPRIDTAANFELLDAEHLVILFEKVMTELAEGGNCVIVGRGANWFLRNRDDSFHTFLYAPYDEKMRRTTAQGESERDAAELIESVDRERAAFVKKYYGKDWPDRSLYNLMINTKIGDEAVVTTILDAVETVNKNTQTTSAGS